MEKKTGTIEYKLWTVSGDVMLKVSYSLEKIGKKIGMGKISIDPPQGIDEPEIDQDTIQEILMECIKDFKQKEVPKKEGFKMIEKFDFGKN